MLELCDAIDVDTVGLLLDSWHWYTAGESIDAIEALDADEAAAETMRVMETVWNGAGL